MVAAYVQSWSGSNKASNVAVSPSTAGAYRAGYTYLMAVVFDNLSATTPTLVPSASFKPTDATWVQVAYWDSPVATAAGGTRGEVWMLSVPATSLGATWGANAGGANLSSAVTAKAVIISEFSGVGTVAFSQGSNVSVTTPSFVAGNAWYQVYGSESATSLSGSAANAFTTGANAQTNVSVAASAGVATGSSPGSTYPVLAGSTDGGVAFVIFNPPVTSLDVSGTVDVVSDNQADVTISSQQVSGTVDVVSTTQGDVTVALQQVSGSVDVVSDSQADVTATGASIVLQVSGTIDAVSTTQLDVTVKQHLVSGTVDAVSTTQTDVSVIQAVSGAVDAVSTTQADVTTKHPISGATDVVSTTQGDVTVKQHLVSGSVDVISTTQADVSLVGAAQFQVSGTVDVVSTTQGDVANTHPVSGSVDVVSTTQGDVSVQQHLVSGAVDVVSTTQADVSLVGAPAALQVSGTVDVVSTTQLDVIANHLISGTVDVVSTTQLDVTVRVHQVSGAVDVVSTTQLDISTKHPVSGTTDVVSTTQGDITLGQQLVSGTVDVISTTQADVSLVGAPPQLPVSGTVDVISTTQLDVTVKQHQVSGTVSVISVSSGDVSNRHQVSGTVDVVSSTQADLRIPAANAVFGTVDVVSSTQGDVIVLKTLVSGTSTVVSTTSGDVTVTDNSVSGTVDVVSSTSLNVRSSLVEFKLRWDNFGERLFETGVDRGVLYPGKNPGVAWNGLISVNENPSGSDVRDNHVDGQKFVNQRSSESFTATIEAFTYPVEFEPYDGIVNAVSSQPRFPFGFSYRTLVGNDEFGSEYSYKIHLVYNAFASPSAIDRKSISGSVGTDNFSWQIDTVPIKMGPSYSAHLVIDPRFAYPDVIDDLERMLYGSPDNLPYLPSPQEILDLFEDASIFKVTDHGDGTWTAEGPDEAIRMLNSTTFEITWPSAVYIDAVTYRLSSL